MLSLMPALPPTVIGLDIETTALEPAEGDIIEIVVIRYNFQSGEEIDRFESLCAASKPLTPIITSLTGIKSDMLVAKPLFASIITQVQKFIGDSYIFAHNASFDISWLAFHGLELKNPVWDTFMLAGVAWPQAESYNLGMLARQLKIRVENEHRAAADIALTWRLLGAIRKKLIVSKKIYNQAEDILQKSGLSHYLCLFRENS